MKKFNNDPYFDLGTFIREMADARPWDDPTNRDYWERVMEALDGLACRVQVECWKMHGEERSWYNYTPPPEAITEIDHLLERMSETKPYHDEKFREFWGGVGEYFSIISWEIRDMLDPPPS